MRDSFVAKRFIETKLHKKPWYRKLPPKIKCTWVFIFCECEPWGIWSIDMEAVEFHVGEPVALEEMMSKINSDKPQRIMKLDEEKIWIPDFVTFQNKKLSINCGPHKPIIHGLKNLILSYPSLSLHKALPKGLRTLKEIEKEIGREKKKGKVLVKDREKELEKEKAMRAMIAMQVGES